MTEPDELARECAVFCRYLCGREPGEYVLARYRAAHELGVVELPATTAFERTVVALARSSIWRARTFDAYSRVFANGGLLRRKLVLLLAILETKSPPADELDAPTSGSSLGMLVHMAWLGARFAFLVVVGALVLVPVRVARLLGGAR